MQQVNDEKTINAQKVDSLQNDNRSKTCCKLSKKINSASPQSNNAHLFLLGGGRTSYHHLSYKNNRSTKPKCYYCEHNKSWHRYSGKKKGFCYLEDCGCLGYKPKGDSQ